MTPTRSQRENLLDKIKAQVSEKYFDPAFNEAAWNATVERHRGTVVDANTTLAFEKAIAAMLAELSPRGRAGKRPGPPDGRQFPHPVPAVIKF